MVFAEGAANGMQRFSRLPTAPYLNSLRRRKRCTFSFDHWTRAIFDCYNIVSEDDRRTAVKKTNAYSRTAPKQQSVTTFPARKKAAEK
jgi:hypothetical protein